MAGAVKKIKVRLLDGFVKYEGKTYKKGDEFEIAEKDYKGSAKKVLKPLEAIEKTDEK